LGSKSIPRLFTFLPPKWNSIVSVTLSFLPFYELYREGAGVICYGVLAVSGLSSRVIQDQNEYVSAPNLKQGLLYGKGGAKANLKQA